MNLLNTLLSMQQTYQEMSQHDTLNEIEQAKYELVCSLLKSVDTGIIQEGESQEPVPGGYSIKITGSGTREEIGETLREIAGALNEPQLDTNELTPVSDISGTWGADCTLTVTLNP